MTIRPQQRAAWTLFVSGLLGAAVLIFTAWRHGWVTTAQLELNFLQRLIGLITIIGALWLIRLSPRIPPLPRRYRSGWIAVAIFAGVLHAAMIAMLQVITILLVMAGVGSGAERQVALGIGTNSTNVMFEKYLLMVNAVASFPVGWLLCIPVEFFPGMSLLVSPVVGWAVGRGTLQGWLWYRGWTQRFGLTGRPPAASGGAK